MKKVIYFLSIVLLAAACGTARQTASNGGEDVNLGYVQEDKDNSTTSVGTLKVKQGSGYSNIYDYLKGRVAGVEVNGTSITIRGLRSINYSNEPLILVDGQQVNDISWLSPEEVERVDVLKDAYSTAMYGSRGANGVILITTRKTNSK